MPLSLVFAIPDHPWVDTAEGAAVRIAMTVGAAGEHLGELLEVTDEQPQDDGSEKVAFKSQRGKISADLTVGADVSATVSLKANGGMTSMGVMLAGRGFVIEEREAIALGAGKNQALNAVLRPIRNGRDLLAEPRRMLVIDFTGLSVDEARQRFPALFQVVLTRVKPERDQNRDQQFREKWWLFGRSRPEFRALTSGLTRYIATVETAKHRIFEFIGSEILPEHKLVAIGSDDSFMLGVLSSRIHVTYAIAAGGWLGVGNDPVYSKTRCFDPFPFPLCGEAEKERIRQLAEELDAHRKRVQARHGLTLTGLYNVLEKLRASAAPGARLSPAAAVALATGPANFPHASLPVGAAAGEDTRAPAIELTAKEKLIHDQGLVSVLKQLHDDLDAAVFAAYHWPATLTDAEILERLVALNAERAAGEKRGIIHWLRPEYQTGKQKAESGKQKELSLPEGKKERGLQPASASQRGGTAKRPEGRAPKQPWPKGLAERVKAVEAALHAVGAPVAPADLAKQFKRAQPAAVLEILQTLVTLGRARKQGGRFTR